MPSPGREQRASAHLAKEHFDDVVGQRKAVVDKTPVAVHERLTREINHWARRANELAAGTSRRSTPQGVTRHIEVKGRHVDADTVTVTANEVLEALNQGEKFLLAIVRVDGGTVDGPHYIRAPFTKELEASVIRVNYAVKDLLARAKPPHLA
jgi:hypothetical protein